MVTIFNQWNVAAETKKIIEGRERKKKEKTRKNRKPENYKPLPQSWFREDHETRQDEDSKENAPDNSDVNKKSTGQHAQANSKGKKSISPELRGPPCSPEISSSRSKDSQMKKLAVSRSGNVELQPGKQHPSSCPPSSHLHSLEADYGLKVSMDDEKKTAVRKGPARESVTMAMTKDVTSQLGKQRSRSHTPRSRTNDLEPSFVPHVPSRADGGWKERAARRPALTKSTNSVGVSHTTAVDSSPPQVDDTGPPVSATPRGPSTRTMRSTATTEAETMQDSTVVSDITERTPNDELRKRFEKLKLETEIEELEAQRMEAEARKLEALARKEKALMIMERLQSSTNSFGTPGTIATAMSFDESEPV